MCAVGSTCGGSTLFLLVVVQNGTAASGYHALGTP